MVVSSLLAVILMLGGHVILEIINLKTPVTIIVNLIGGAYMIYLLVKENIHD
jgi:iron complex transport system permease protein